MGKKAILHVNFSNFSKISNLNWFFAQTRKKLQLAFLISFRIIKASQSSIKIHLILLKLALSSQNSPRIHENRQNSDSFHWIFDYVFNIIVSYPLKIIIF